jgi:hypothetical protein
MDSEDAAVLVTMLSSFAIGSVVFTPVGGAILALVLGFYVMYVRQYELKYIPR